MSYLNDQVGYREELLATRSVIKKENYVLLEPDGLVKNSIPGYEHCDVKMCIRDRYQPLSFWDLSAQWLPRQQGLQTLSTHFHRWYITRCCWWQPLDLSLIHICPY